MTVFTIDAENHISAFSNTAEAGVAVGTGVQTFVNQKDRSALEELQ